MKQDFSKLRMGSLTSMLPTYLTILTAEITKYPECKHLSEPLSVVTKSAVRVQGYFDSLA